MSLIKINGVEIPTPSTFNPSIMNLSNSERNANGMMIMEIIAQKQKLELSWKIISAEKLSSVLNLIDSTFFQVEYPNPKTNKTTTKTMYSGSTIEKEPSNLKKSGSMLQNYRTFVELYW